MENFSTLNWLAIGLGTIVSFLIGWLWYSPKLFGVKWAEGSGVSLDSADKMPVFAMVAQIVALFLLALTIGLTAQVEALITAILIILAVASFTASMGGFVKKSRYAITVDALYIIVSGAIMIVCQGIL
jgi:hypothetical protein